MGTCEKDTRIECYIKMANSVTTASSKWLLFYDMEENKILYATDHPYIYGNSTRNMFLERGQEAFEELIYEDDRPLLMDLSYAAKPFFSGQNMALENILYFNCRIISKGKAVLVGFRVSVLDYNTDGKPTILLIAGWPSIHKKTRVVLMRHQSSRGFEFLERLEGQWVPIEEARLSELECNILRLARRGFTISEISDAMCRSLNTIKTYRKDIFQKLKVDNITSAAIIAEAYGII